ncbi:hypothetical protein GGF41_005318 [Coemansia sp. RSA 2531]|nr:hypothetical protein GGF41_005318 [Coemansia sp. RSA 2531]
MPEWIASATRSPEGYLLVPEEVAALNLRQLEMNNYQQCQARAFYNLGLASWLSTKQRSALTLADVFMDESSTLAIQEQQVLLPLMQPAPVQPATTQPATTSAQVEDLAPEAANDNSEERPIPNSAPTTPERQVAEVVSRKAGSLPPPSSASLPASLPQDSSEKAAPAASSASTDPPAEPVAATTSAANPALAATVSPARAISVAIHSPGSSRIGKTQVLRHSNPLLCTWNALAICFFRKWHVAGEPTPDFGSPQWLSERLFTGASGASADMIAEDFEMAFKEACREISSDR